MKTKLFKKQVEHYFFKIFKLYEYQLEIREGDEEEDSRAWSMWWNIEKGAQQAIIEYNPAWLKEADDEQIALTAFHEVIEILLSRFEELCKKRDVSDWQIVEEKHRIIRRFENIVYPMLKDIETVLSQFELVENENKRY